MCSCLAYLSVTATIKVTATGVDKGKKLAVIFNYNKIEGLDERLGSYQDVSNFTWNFKKMNFEVKSYTDLTKEDTEKILEEYRTSQDLENVSVWVAIFMSHGDGKNPESFLSSDAKSISMAEDVRFRFNDLNCPFLKGKPKVMIGVCCRSIEDKKDGEHSTTYGKDNTSNKTVGRYEVQNISDDSNTINRLAVDAKAMPCPSTLSNATDFNDMMTIYSCVRGNISYRDEKNGSLFVQTFCNVINKYGYIYDMYRIFAETQREMREKRPYDVIGLGYEPCMDPPLTFTTLYLG
ncbi:Caspase-like domain [Trinorchestia longiramus]|nr:Caspase-like domain [Trinorchestia longiramus]